MMENDYQALFIAYFNDFLSVREFASWYGIEEEHAEKIIKKGRIINEEVFGYLPSSMAAEYH